MTEPTDLDRAVERLEARRDAWSLNEDTARVNIRLGDLRTILAALASPQQSPISGEGWQDISTAPDLDRVMVCGWNPPHKRVAGYWWWHEDSVYEGRAIDHPTALYWCRVNLPAFPPPPVPSVLVGEG